MLGNSYIISVTFTASYKSIRCGFSFFPNFFLKSMSVFLVKFLTIQLSGFLCLGKYGGGACSDERRALGAALRHPPTELLAKSLIMFQIKKTGFAGFFGLHIAHGISYLCIPVFSNTIYSYFPEFCR